MFQSPATNWQPTRFMRFEKALDTSMGTARIVTDAGKAYCKALGNPEGPHALACEWVGTQLARWLGLPTLDFAILHLEKDDEIPFHRGGQAQPGPAFVTRAEKGHVWGGDSDELSVVENPDDIARLVVFDTWTLNCDRHPPDLSARAPNYDNVFLSAERAAPGRFRVIAMDHTHCFTCGRDLTERIATIDRTKDERIYGLFPGFVATLQVEKLAVAAALGRLREFGEETGVGIVGTIPREWQVDDRVRAALANLIYQRSRFVADNLIHWLAPDCWPQRELKFGEGESQ